MVEGLPNISVSKGVCEGCVLGKHPREKFDTDKTHRASSPLDLIHSDLMGPFSHPSVEISPIDQTDICNVLKHNT